MNTIIDVHFDPDDNDNYQSPTYGRSMMHFQLYSTIRFEKVTYTYLGFHARSDGKRAIRHRGDKFEYFGLLDPNSDAHTVIGPYRLCLQNIGDGFVGVHVRLLDGIQRCKMTLLQEKYQPEPPREAGMLIKYEDIWYVTTTINSLQTVRIEEIAQEKGDIPDA